MFYRMAILQTVVSELTPNFGRVSHNRAEDAGEEQSLTEVRGSTTVFCLWERPDDNTERLDMD